MAAGIGYEHVVHRALPNDCRIMDRARVARKFVVTQRRRRCRRSRNHQRKWSGCRVGRRVCDLRREAECAHRRCCARNCSGGTERKSRRQSASRNRPHIPCAAPARRSERSGIRCSSRPPARVVVEMESAGATGVDPPPPLEPPELQPCTKRSPVTNANIAKSRKERYRLTTEAGQLSKCAGRDKVCSPGYLAPRRSNVSAYFGRNLQDSRKTCLAAPPGRDHVSTNPMSQTSRWRGWLGSLNRVL